MLSDLPLFQVYGAMARHAAETQRVSAANIARADEPGFKAQQIEPFSDYLARAKAQGAESASALTVPFKVTQANLPASPNGNTVSLETEIFKSADAAGQHNMALTVYTKSLDLMRTAIGKRG